MNRSFCFHSGKLRYANNSNYKNDVMIRKEVKSAAWWRNIQYFVICSILNSKMCNLLDFPSFRLMYIKVWWKSWRESLTTVRSQKKMMPCGPLPTESADRFVGTYILQFLYSCFGHHVRCSLILSILIALFCAS